MTDSGAIQEETTFLGIPCFTVRDNTERPITVWEGTNKLIGVNEIEYHVEQILKGNGKKGKIPDLWDGKAAGGQGSQRSMRMRRLSSTWDKVF